MTITADISTATSIQAANTAGLSSNALTTALSTLTADGATPTSAHVSSAVSAQASISTVKSTALSTVNSASVALSTTLSTLTADAGSPTSAHVSSAVSANTIYQTAVSVAALSSALSTVQADWNTQGGGGGAAVSYLQPHYAAASQASGGVQVNLVTDLSSAISALQ